MADWENRLGQESPLTRALRLAMPGDFANPMLHPRPQDVNPFMLLPQQPRAELRNPAPRPGDYLSPVSEALSPTMGAYGLGNALGDAYVQGREGNYKGMASPLAEILLGMAPVPGMKKGAMPPRVENPIRAYHGSPHDFDKFDLSKIGTGEGAQAFGHGLYFAEREGVARSYRDAITAKFDPFGAFSYAASDMSHLPAKDITFETAKKMQSRDPALSWMSDDNLRDMVIYAKEANLYRPLASDAALAAKERVRNSVVESPPGKMYEVAIHASPDQFLDWDKPLSQQSEAVRKAVETAGWRGKEPKFSDAQLDALKAEADAAHKRYLDLRAAYFEDAWKNPKKSEADFNNLPEAWRAQNEIHSISNRINDAMREREALTGKGILEALSDSPMFGATYDKATANVSSKLNEAGIPGIRYLDQGSRGAGNGTSNFVVFDPNLIEILRKYGLLGPVAAGATANALMGDKDSQ